ncbi:sensor histidine kinase [Sphingobacterium sp. 18053]|uniref:sensor histidine kinase n=1 Tax=Sphingobacterium sp. 18053 TaxID=2681401 RepID=UPI00190F47BD|nr:histidine kinase [Sphingobacterium sp. 18053]
MGIRIVNSRLYAHLIFWICVIAFLSVLFQVGGPGYWAVFKVLMMLIPVHICYFYTLSYIVIPRYLYTRKYLQLALMLLFLAFVAALAYRLIEILFADPYFLKEMRKFNPMAKWKKLDGTFWHQLSNPEYFIHALEQSNSVVWIGLVIKFVQMWHERKQVALQSELNFLKSQIHPHFLFNTLNNLYALTLKQSTKSPEVVLGLSDILRYMLYECDSDYVALRRDVAIIQNYLTLERLRYGDRLDLNFNLKGEIGEQLVAPLLMIPLIENAFKHGASEMMEEAWINIDLDVDDRRLKLKVSNGRPDPDHIAGSSCGNIGLLNLRKRLELLYPQRHALTIFEEDDMYLVILEIQFGGDVSAAILRKEHPKIYPVPEVEFGTRTSSL